MHVDVVSILFVATRSRFPGGDLPNWSPDKAADHHKTGSLLRISALAGCRVVVEYFVIDHFATASRLH